MQNEIETENELQIWLEMQRAQGGGFRSAQSRALRDVGPGLAAFKVKADHELNRIQRLKKNRR